MSQWDPGQYERFKNERSRPFYDLLALVVTRPSMRVVDLGCGTGELTAELHQRLGAIETIGVDSSETMLQKSAALATANLRFERARIEDWSPHSPLDLVFSNAALHWVDDHPALFARLVTFLAPNGQIAVQMPSNDDHPSHRAAAEVASESPFREALGGFVRRFPNLAIDEYARLLDELGFHDPNVRLQVYLHHLTSRDEVFEWTRGTLLTAYLERLPKELHAPFLARYREALRACLPEEHPYRYPFKRILVHATKA